MSDLIKKAQVVMLSLLVVFGTYLAVGSSGCVLSPDGTREFSPEAAYAEVSLAITDLEVVEEMFLATEGKEGGAESVRLLIEALDDFRDTLQIYINGGGEGDALKTSFAALEYLADYQWDDPDYQLYGTVLKIALNRVRAYLPELQ